MWYLIAALFLLTVCGIIFYEGIIIPDRKNQQPTFLPSGEERDYTGGLTSVPAELLTRINAALLLLDPDSSPTLFAQCAYSVADTWAREKIGGE